MIKLGINKDFVVETSLFLTDRKIQLVIVKYENADRESKTKIP